MSEKKEIKVIKNIAFLSVLSDKENAMLKNVDVIKNVAFLMVREGFYTKYPNIAMKNIANTVVVPEGMEVATSVGMLTIDNAFLESISNKVHLAIVGAVIFEPETDSKMIAEKIAAIHLTGAAICRESTAGAVSSLLKGQTAVTVTYPDDISATVRAENGDNIVLSHDYIESLNDNTILIINGIAHMMEDIDKTVLSKKVLKIVTNGIITISQQNHKVVAGKLILNGKSTVIPTGFEYVDNDININENNLSVYEDRNIFCTKSIYFDNKLTPELMINSPFRLICEKAVCKKNIVKQVSQTLEKPETQMIVYDNELIINHAKRKITSKELSFAKVPVHILNYGNMDFDEDMDDELLYEKVAGIYNYGSIKCSEKSYGLIQSKIIEDQGEIKIYDEKEPENNIVEIALLENMATAEL